MRPDDIVQMREWALEVHRDWKQRSLVSDLITQKKWSTIWPDLTVDANQDPLVEDTYTSALLDKAFNAAAPEPQIEVAPSLGTRADRGELEAQRKRKVFRTYQRDSRYDFSMRARWFMDDWQHGACYGMPWMKWNDLPRYPFFTRLDPRFVYPLAHDSRGELTAVIATKLRRVLDLKGEYGEDHPAILELAAYRSQMGYKLSDQETVEELWYWDTTKWGTYLYDEQGSPMQNRFRYIAPNYMPASGAKAIPLWPIETHRLGRCPVMEYQAPSNTNEYRGRLDSMIPSLRLAHNLMALTLRDTTMQVWAPVLLQNIINPEEWGPDARLRNLPGEVGKAEYVRPPINFDAKDSVDRAIEAARQDGAYPQQRGGEPGASIVSKVGINASQGQYNTDMAAAQAGHETLLAGILERTAAIDKKWTKGRKQITGFDEGEAFDEKYDPFTLFGGDKMDDYRVVVSYGSRMGLDDQSHLTRLAIGRQFGLSKRTALIKSGMVDNVLAEENEASIEFMAEAFMSMALQQQQAGNIQPILAFLDLVDSQKMTARQAMIEAFGRAQVVPTGAQGQGGGAPPNQNPQLVADSLAAGGVPGQAQGQPAGITDTLRRVLPQNLQRSPAAGGP